MQFDLKDLSKSRVLKGDYLWPNELTMFSDKNDRPILLVPDGFLLPGMYCVYFLALFSGSVFHSIVFPSSPFLSAVFF